MSQIRQTSFSWGALSPYLWGRTDLEMFQHGARRLSNFYINKQGSAVSRDGTEFMMTCASGARVFGFVDQVNEGLIFEFTDRQLRVIHGRTNAVLGTYVTGFTKARLPQLQYTQQGKSAVVTHPDFPPQEYRVVYGYGSIYGFNMQVAPFVEIPSDVASRIDSVWPSIGGNAPADPALVSWNQGSLFGGDASHPIREWRWKVSTLVRDNITGDTFETLPRDVTKYVAGKVSDGTYGGPSLNIPGDNLVMLAADAPVYLAPGSGAAYTNPQSARLTVYRYVYYRGRGDAFGLVGTSDNSGLFADFGEEPDYLSPPLRGDSPWRTGDYPYACEMFQQRRVLAGGNLRPTRMVTSGVDAFEDFDMPRIAYPGMPLEFSLLGRGRSRLYSLLAADSLLAFADTGVWAIGRPDIALDYDTIATVTRQIADIGVDRNIFTQPLLLDGGIAYIARGRRKVQMIAPTQNGANVMEMTAHVGHFFSGDGSSQVTNQTTHQIVAWGRQTAPQEVIWIALASGKVLSCTQTGQASFAWAEHDFGGQVISMCSVARESSSALFSEEMIFIVKRGNQTCMERMISREGIKQDAIVGPQPTYPLDSWSTFVVNKTTGTNVGGLGRLTLGGPYTVWASYPGIAPIKLTGDNLGNFSVPAGWGPPGANNFTCAIGLGYVCDLETLDAAPNNIRFEQKAIVEVGFEVSAALGISVGQDVDNLVEWRQRTVDDSYHFMSPATAFAAVQTKGAWRNSGRAVLRQAYPLPVTVLAITRKIEVGGAK